jgi:hypothetical protein
MVRRWPPDWGWPGAAALLALLLATPLVLWITPLWEDDTQKQRRQRLSALHPATVPLPAPAAPQLPLAGPADERIAGLLKLAARHGVLVDAAQQHLDPAGAVPTLQLQLTARGAYVDLRAFIDAGLLADAALGLEQLRLQRPGAAAATLRADLRFSLLLPAVQVQP